MAADNRAGRDRSKGFGFALILGNCLLLLSFLRIWGDTGSALFGGDMFDTALSGPVLGTALGMHITRFVIAQIIVYSSFGILAWVLAAGSQRIWGAADLSRRVWILLWFLALTVWVLMANAYWFPGSSLGQPYATAVRAGLFGIPIFAAYSGAVLAAMLWLMLAGAVRFRNRILKRRYLWGAAVVLICSSAAVPVIDVIGRDRQESVPDRPNIIVIGLDSLRTDYVNLPRDRLAVNLNDYLAEATQFTDTTTPLARTFPAWISILTGRHPHTTGARINLAPRASIDEGDTLADILRGHGYRTVFAIDESRFANIDETYGFDQIIAPPMGAADFVLEFFSDTPVSNLLVNTLVGKQLFPYAHANRGVSRTYDPDAFLDRVSRELRFDGPTFLAIHLTLVHWPYTWADSNEVIPDDNGNDDVPKYERTVQRVDLQFGELVRRLKARGALDNAIVVVLSDHGESLGEPSPLQREDGTIEPVLGAAEIRGHGTHVFSMDQYRVLLGFRTYGQTPLTLEPGGSVTAPVSLEDIAPTLLEALDIEHTQAFDGQSLLPLLDGRLDQSNFDEERVRFIETEFNPPALLEGEIPSANEIFDVVEKYRVDPETDRVLFREQYLDEILENRQYAAISGDDMLASIPSVDPSEQHLVYYSLDSANWRWLDDVPDSDTDGEIWRLWESLSGRFEAVIRRPVVPVGQEQSP